MGLDLLLSRIDHNGPSARWAYSGFHEFRRRLANEVGIALEEMQGFGDPQRSWKDFGAEPLLPLLNHSDCEGDLDYKACLLVAPRLREIVARWDEHDYDRQMAERLADMMDEVIAEDAFRIEFR